MFNLNEQDTKEVSEKTAKLAFTEQEALRLRNWEEEFNEYSICKPWELNKDKFFIDASPEEIKQFISDLIDRVRKEIWRDNDISSWMNYGKERKYWEFFEKQILKDHKEIVEYYQDEKTLKAKVIKEALKIVKQGWSGDELEELIKKI